MGSKKYSKKHELPTRLIRGGSKKSHEAKVPTAAGRGGRIDTNLNLNIPWTPRNRTIAATVLGVPFLLVTVVAFKLGYTLGGLILVGLACFVGLMYLALRFIEANEV